MKDEDQAIPGDMATAGIDTQFVLCIEVADCDDLKKGKVYVQMPDPDASRNHCLLVIDESGGDYLYPEAWFVAVDLPKAAREALAR